MAAVSIFLPYILACIFLVGLALYVLLNRRTRKLVFSHKDTKILLMFFMYILIVPCIYRNWVGLIVAIVIMLGVLLGCYMRSVMTTEIYEKVLRLICILSLTGASCAISERFIIPLFNRSYYTKRISAMFFYPNYFATVIAIVIIICAYKVLTRQGRIYYYYGIAAINVISMYLCGSMFVWVEVFLGVAVLLVVLKKHRLLAGWLFVAAILSFLILVLNINIIPRLSDAELTTKLRIHIWQLAIAQIKKTPLFGHGLLSYLFIYDRYYKDSFVPHAHSIYLDLLLNFGIFGTLLFVWYMLKFYTNVFLVCFKEKYTLITSLIISITAAAMAHGLIDVTLLWVQTLPLFIIILAGIGACEKGERIRTGDKDNDAKQSY